MGGASQSTNYQYINGKSSRSNTWTYQLRAKEPGEYYIPPATFTDGESVYETEPVSVTVLPNPEGIPQKNARSSERSRMFDFTPPRNNRPPNDQRAPRKNQKKRKIYRI